jgi:hypothetical protein
MFFIQYQRYILNPCKSVPRAKAAFDRHPKYSEAGPVLGLLNAVGTEIASPASEANAFPPMDYSSIALNVF